MQSNFVDAGLLEIYRFVPPPLLERVGDPLELDLEDFVRLLAKARYLEDIEAWITAEGIARAFADDGEA